MTSKTSTSEHLELCQLLLEQERRRIARELHDTIGQELTALRLEVNQLTKKINPQNEPARALAKELDGRLDHVMLIVRGLARELWPVGLEAFGLVAATETLLSDFELRTGIRCTLNTSLDNDRGLDRPLALSLYRIIQESITNAAKHASTPEIEVELAKLSSGVIVLQVRDFGVGVRTDFEPGGHTVGMIGMKERVNMLGGSFSFGPHAEKGALVRVEIPAGQARRET